MLNIRKRFFLLLTIIGALICFVACTKTDTLRVSFDQTVYEIKVGQTLDIKPIIEYESSVNTIQYEYLSTDSTVATFVVPMSTPTIISPIAKLIPPFFCFIFHNVFILHFL